MESAEKIKKESRLRTMTALGGACLLTTVMFIVIGMRIPWAIIPAAGGGLMLLGYNWGYLDRLSGKTAAEEAVKELSLLFASQNSPRSRIAYEFDAISQIYSQGSAGRGKRFDVSGSAVRRLAAKKRQMAAASGYAGSSQRSGDSYCWENLHNGKFAVAISDGMGKGEKAAQESTLAVNAVIKLLKAGLDPELALKLLNLILMLDGGTEIYTTMDLAVVDSRSRELKIYKIGAAPTVIRRKSGIEVLTAPAMPMGIMEYEHIPCVSTMVSAGDQVIMMTDGIVDSLREDLEMKWLKKLLGKIKSRSTQTVCDLIIREAAINYGSREKDDMTVVAFEVR